MTTLQIGMLALIFLAVFALVAGVMIYLSPNQARERLRDLVPNAGTRSQLASSNPWMERAVRMASRLGKYSLPDDGWEQSSMRVRFMNAGIRSTSAPTFYFGAKTCLAIGLPGLLYFYMVFTGSKVELNNTLLLLLLTAALGYYLPNAWLSNRVTARQREIFESFPDALDLMTVCVEAGLGVEAALSRVAGDIEHKSIILSDELNLVGLELRAGSDRERALRNLAIRTGVDEVETWVAMLIQAERFGTSIAAALRIHSEMLRTKRRQRAEEAAAKIALKLLFPLIFCIFPSLLLVLMGPAFIQIYRILLPTMGGTAP